MSIPGSSTYYATIIGIGANFVGMAPLSEMLGNNTT